MAGAGPAQPGGGGVGRRGLGSSLGRSPHRLLGGLCGEPSGRRRGIVVQGPVRGATLGWGKAVRVQAASVRGMIFW